MSGPRQSVEQLLTRWLEDVIKPNKKVRTYQTYTEKLRLHIVPEIGKLSVSALTATRLQRLNALKRETLAPATVSLIHVVIYGALKWAEECGEAGHNVAQRVRRPERPRLDGRERALTLEQTMVLRKAVVGHRFGNFFTLLLDTGLRFGEAAALRLADVDFECRVLRVQRTLTRLPKEQGSFGFDSPKTSSSRQEVPLNGHAVAALRAQNVATKQARLFAGSEWQDHGLVFPNRVGKPLRDDHVLSAFHQVCQAAGLPRHRLHDLRHTTATLVHASGADVHDLKNLLGHSRVDMTSQIYTGYAIERVRGMMDVFGASCGPAADVDEQSGSGAA